MQWGMFFVPGRLPGCAQAHAEGVSVTCGAAGSAKGTMAGVSPAAGPGIPVTLPALWCTHAAEPVGAEL